MGTEHAGQADALLGELRRQTAGRLTVFLGAAPGVGKTYAMLARARELHRQGWMSSLVSSRRMVAARRRRWSRIAVAASQEGGLPRAATGGNGSGWAAGTQAGHRPGR
ncbi:hypothetical protein [Ottowia beijingensis]|uniref:hypothetical protein n=1 Tax=Ottowia beijingensis TaxID=1207057 RepID=UPI00214DC978|nr:hypothetical protein [Ottowia beijingensis]